MKATIYNTLTGEILRVVNAPEDMLAMQAQEGETLLMSDSDDMLHYVNQGELLNRPSTSVILDKLSCAADGLDAVEVTGIPIGATVTLGSLSQTATLSTASLAFDIAGDYQLKVELFPYLPFEVKISAV